jgi:hypothetical protein
MRKFNGSEEFVKAPIRNLENKLENIPSNNLEDTSSKLEDTSNLENKVLDDEPDCGCK